MGRHTKLPEGDEAPYEEPRRGGQGRNWGKMLVSVPLLPMVALVIAIGVVSYAWGTSQISLNFAGGSPPERPQQAQADARDNADGQGDRTGVLIAFRAVKRRPDGFTGTVTITNRTGKAVDGWLLGFKFPKARVLTITNSRVVRKGQVTWVRNPTARRAIAPGATVRLTFTASGTAARPSACKFNKANCTMV